MRSIDPGINITGMGVGSWLTLITVTPRRLTPPPAAAAALAPQRAAAPGPPPCTARSAPALPAAPLQARVAGAALPAPGPQSASPAQPAGCRRNSCRVAGRDGRQPGCTMDEQGQQRRAAGAMGGAKPHVWSIRSESTVQTWQQSSEQLTCRPPACCACRAAPQGLAGEGRGGQAGEFSPCCHEKCGRYHAQVFGACRTTPCFASRASPAYIALYPAAVCAVASSTCPSPRSAMKARWSEDSSTFLRGKMAGRCTDENRSCPHCQQWRASCACPPVCRARMH